MTTHIRKKVIIFITKSNWGGAQKYVFDLATHIPKELFEVVVVLGGKELLYTKLVGAGVRTIKLDGLQRDISITKDLHTFFNILKIIKNEKPDVIHVNSTKISGLAAVAGRIMGVKNIIFTVHGWAFNENRTFFSRGLIKTLYLTMLWLSHNIIAVSNKITTQVQGWPFSKNKMKVIHNGIQSPYFLDTHNARMTLGKILNTNISDSTILCGSIGELHPIKGHIYSIKALEQILKEKPDLNIAHIIIGDGDIQNELEQEIIDRGLTGKVFLAGYIKEAATYLKAFNYYLFPSISEGLPYAVVEAGFAKLPVIASDVGGISEIIENKKEGILIPSQNTQAIVDALYTYIDNPELAKKYSVALHTKTISEFTVKTMIEKTKAIYLK